MSDAPTTTVKEICQAHENKRDRLMDIVLAVHEKFGHLSDEVMDEIASALSMPRVEVQSLASFYAFFSQEPKGKVVIRLCNDIVDEMAGYEEVKKAFVEALGIELGQTTPDGAVTLEAAPCIGMCDQAPAALVNEVVVTNLTPAKAREIVQDLKSHGDPTKLVKELGDGNNAHDLVKAMVKNNIHKAGPVIFSPVNRGEAVRKSLGMTPKEVIRAVKTARLRGRGGAGFPAGMKWEFTRDAEGSPKYIACNADEGEPGTFKDRVLLTELPNRVFAGMTIAGYAVGAEHGILYLRGEYAYLRDFLEGVLDERRKDGLLGHSILGKEGFNFDIRIQLGAGAYVCGEETALLSSCEGLRGDPKTRPPFPAQKGYLGKPTVVNNVETLCAVTKIMEEGAGTYSHYGTEQSAGTKILSISGDCQKPGIYEVEFGISMRAILEMVGATDTLAMQIGGPSGQMIDPSQFDRLLCFDDLATGGAIVIFNKDRDLLKIAAAYMEFFIEESCGYCTPCRAGNVLLKERLDKVIDGNADTPDLEYLEGLGDMVKTCSRCGLGQTSPNPILSTLKNFRSLYEARLREDKTGLLPTFDLAKAVAEGERITGRLSVHAHS
jgi:[NiFe] hydrogenase diaphorase moiety large subunit